MILKTYDVVIATPGWEMEADYVRSLLETTQYLSNKKISWNYVNGRSSVVSQARESCLFYNMTDNGINTKIFDNHFDYKKIFWIDSDMSWSVDSFIEIFSSDKDVISGVYMMGDNTSIAAHPLIGHLPMSRELMESVDTDLIKVDACGMGFMCITKKAIESLQRPIFSDLEIEIKNNADKSSFICTSEDTSFCEKIRRSGFDIYINKNVKVGHIKKKILSV